MFVNRQCLNIFLLNRTGFWTLPQNVSKEHGICDKRLEDNEILIIWRSALPSDLVAGKHFVNENVQSFKKSLYCIG